MAKREKSFVGADLHAIMDDHGMLNPLVSRQLSVMSHYSVRSESGSVMITPEDAEAPFKLIRLIGRGGFGNVYLGDWEAERVAIKVRPDSQQTSPRTTADSVPTQLPHTRIAPEQSKQGSSPNDSTQAAHTAQLTASHMARQGEVTSGVSPDIVLWRVTQRSTVWPDCRCITSAVCDIIAGITNAKACPTALCTCVSLTLCIQLSA